MARKSDDSASGFLIIIVIVVYPFIWLYEKLGKFWFWVIVIGLPILMLAGWILSLRQGANELVTITTDDSTENFSNRTHDGWSDYIEGAWKRGDYDTARKMLQKIAYSMVGKHVTQHEKDNFTRVMEDFAKEDPLYKDVMLRLLPIVRSNPGMLQSKIYEGQPDDVKEQMRYVLYFANELGHISRVKKGNSYKLYAESELA